EADLGIPVVAVNPRKNKGLNELKKVITQLTRVPEDSIRKNRDFISLSNLAPEALADMQAHFPVNSEYASLHQMINGEELIQNAD
ncbi:hypothetical protein ABTL43_19680, partial [Acinetobacter baumannii]